jgi:hypothetical protein
MEVTDAANTKRRKKKKKWCFLWTSPHLLSTWFG